MREATGRRRLGAGADAAEHLDLFAAPVQDAVLARLDDVL